MKKGIWALYTIPATRYLSKICPKTDRIRPSLLLFLYTRKTRRITKITRIRQATHQVRWFCKKLSTQEIETRIKAGEKYVIRMKVPDNRVIEFNDLIRGKISVHSKEIDDQILNEGRWFSHLSLGTYC
jgi:hypothetical protein